MTIEGVKSLSDKSSIEAMEKYVDELLSQNIYTKTNPNWNGNAFLSYKNYLVTVGKAIANTNTLDLVALQTAFKAMNPGPIGTGKVWNPIALVGPPPGAIGRMTDSADIPDASSNPRSDFSRRQDKEKQEARQAQQKKIDSLNMYDVENKFNDKYYIDIDQPNVTGQDGMQTVQPVPGVSYSIPDYSKLFERRSVGPDFGDGQKGYNHNAPIKASRISAAEEVIRRRSAIQNDDAFFARSDLVDGLIDVSGEELPEGVSDAGNYMPFFLEDLRSPGKRIYFRAFFKNFRESIAPEWSQEKYFGRVEPVGIYMGTSRSISINFAVVAMSPAGFTAMWRKLNALTKLLYPTYRNGVMVKSPVARLRIGDVICDQSGNGLAGYISSPLELDYSESPWEISEWTGYSDILEMGKAPMMALVSFTFQVIHERNPSLDEDGNFDTSIFRRIGGLPNSGDGLSEQTFTFEDIEKTEQEIARSEQEDG